MLVGYAWVGTRMSAASMTRRLSLGGRFTNELELTAVVADISRATGSRTTPSMRRV